MAGQMRLDKYLGEMGMGTRSQLKEAAKKGRILVNGEVEKKTERKIVPGSDVVSFDGQPVSYVEMEYYMLNKPQGVVSATEDKRHQTVVELIGDRKRDDLFPVGRLDIDTEGLLLITNDGDLAHRLLSPKRHVDKVYFARLEGELPADAVERLARGITLTDGTPTLPARLEIQKQGGGESEILLTIHEGKFHQVKRMFEALGCQVVYLKRMSMGPLVLDGELQPGEYRALSEEELEALKNA
ncbi:MAG: rRNA pseudouridine synthase [Hungatella hathewayi]|nr:rRNA pseudouridine synthase [Hungatella hathewayi]